MAYDSNNNFRRGVVNGQAGTWVPVEQGKLPDTVSTDPSNPSVGTDNNYYYADPFTVPGQNAPYGTVPYANGNAYNPQYGAPRPISANMHNAIPTPSSIVQLPPIVQPISLVPYASQNQPLVQYDPNVRPDIPETKTPEPVYRRKPYTGLSVAALIISIIAILVGCLVPSGKAAVTNVINLMQEGQVVGLLNGDMSMLLPVVVGALYALAFIFIVIVLIDALVKLCVKKAVAKFNVLNLLAVLCLVAAAVVSMLLLKAEINDCISALVMVVLIIIMMFVVGFANREAVEIDYVASKQTFIMK